MNYSRVGCSGLIYDGVNLSDTFQIANVSIPLLPTFEAVTHDLAQRPGAYFAMRKVGTRQIKVRLRLDAESRDPMDIFKAWREVSSTISKDEPKRLYLNDDKWCNAIVVGESVIEESAYYGDVELSFMCYDPYFYGAEHEASLASGAASTFHVSGSVSAFPTIELVASASTVVVTNETTAEYVRIPSLSIGTALSIDMERQLVTVADAYQPVDLLSDFFAVDGDASVSVSGASGTLKYVERFL